MESTLLVIVIAVAVLLAGFLVIILVKQNKQDLQKNSRQEIESNQEMGKGIAIGIPIGMSTGVGIGVAIDNIAVGISIGLSIGIAIGVAMGAAFKKKAEQQSMNSSFEIQKNAGKVQNNIPVVLGLLFLFASLLFLGVIFYLRTK